MPSDEPPSIETIRFRGFSLEMKPLALSRDGETVPLQLRPLQLLAFLSTRTGTLVTHDQLREHLWGNRTVSFNNSIHVYVSQIRAALDDDANNPTFIENVPRQGYRFLPTTEKIVNKRARIGLPWTLQSIQWRAAQVGIMLLAAALIATLFALIPDSKDPVTRPHVNADALGSYRRGEYLLNRYDADATKNSIHYFEAALRIEPTFAEAHLGAARALSRLGMFEDADARAQSAIDLNADLADAYVVSGYVDVMYEWQWDDALKNFQTALEKDNSSVAAHQGIATYFVLQGNLNSAIRHMELALRIDPA